MDATNAALAAPLPVLEAPAPVRVQVPPHVLESILAAAPLFAGADRTLLERVASTASALEFVDGATLIAAGAPAEGIGLLVKGAAFVLLPDADGGLPTPLEALQAPGYFGEAGVLARHPNVSSVVANGPCRVIWLPADVVRSVAGVFAPFSETLSRRLAEQISVFAHLAPRLAQLPASPLEEEDASSLLRPLAETMAPISLSALLAAAPPPPQPSILAAEPPGPSHVPFVELSEYDLQPSVLNMIPVKLIRQHRLLPVKLTNQQLTLAMVAPKNQAALAELRRLLPTVDLAVVAISSDDFYAAFARLKLDDVRPGGKANTKGAPSINPDSLVYETSETEREAAQAIRVVGDDAIKLVNRIVIAGLEREASDIHIEPLPTGVRVRFRVNGVLLDWAEPIALTLAKSIVARVKVLAGLDITERRLPQDGRIGFTIAGKREVDLRVSSLPANRGEKIVLRILEASGSTRLLEHIFLEPNVLAAARRALNRPFGGIVIAGATGSGKTSTLYSLLNERKTTRPDTNVIMVEDPIEYRLPGVTQVQANAASGLGFPQALRAMLRQDPDVIVVGETRDHETAQMALEAAMTGHLLLTSLHANNALSALQRLENLGCSRALMAQSLSLVLVQRLVRKLCQACVQLDTAPKALLDTLVARKVVAAGDNVGLPRPVGCDACHQTGYVGRAPVFEALTVTDEIRNALNAARPLGEIEQIALAARVLVPFHAYSAFLMSRKLISASEALLTVAD